MAMDTFETRPSCTIMACIVLDGVLDFAKCRERVEYTVSLSKSRFIYKADAKL